MQQQWRLKGLGFTILDRKPLANPRGSKYNFAVVKIAAWVKEICRLSIKKQSPFSSEQLQLRIRNQRKKTQHAWQQQHKKCLSLLKKIIKLERVNAQKALHLPLCFCFHHLYVAGTKFFGRWLPASEPHNFTLRTHLSDSDESVEKLAAVGLHDSAPALKR